LIPQAFPCFPFVFSGVRVLPIHDELIRHVRVVDADGVREDRRVTISAGLITAEEPDTADPSSSGEQIDGTGLTLVPGLWDAHVHLMSSAGTNIRSSRRPALSSPLPRAP
jgi:imidazolonepropionase-like amidohydrolase